jgi:hypothetical protein
LRLLKILASQLSEAEVEAVIAKLLLKLEQVV